MKRFYSVFFVLFSLIMIQKVYPTELFYLSSEKTFSTAETKRVKLESAPSIKNLNIRVYRILDPLKFYQSQPNVQKPEINGFQFRKDVLDVYQGVFQFLKSGIRNWARESIPFENRKKSLDFFDEMKMKFRGETVQTSHILKPLQDKNLKVEEEFIFDLPSNEKYWNYNYLFLENIKSEGMYLIESSWKGQVGYTVLNVSDTGLILKKSEKELLVYAVNNQNGKPAAKTEIIILDRFKNILKKSSTDKNGILSLPMKENDIFIIGKSGKGSAFYDLKYYPMTIQDLRVYAYTAQPVYKGGDQVFFKGMIRNYQDGDYEKIKPQGLEVGVVNSRGEEFQTLSLYTNDMGSFDGSFMLPKDTPSGRYLLIARVNGKPYEAEFKVDYFQKPEYEVKVKAAKKLYLSGEMISGTIEAKYYFGDPVKKAEVTYSIYRSRFQDSEWDTDKDKPFYLSKQEAAISQLELLETKTGVLDDKGQFSFAFLTKKENSNYYYKIEAKVSDSSNVKITGSSRVQVVTSNLKLGCSADKFVFLLNETVKLQLKSVDFAETPIPNTLTVKIVTEQEGGQIYTFLEKSVQTDKEGKAEISFKADKTGFIKIFVTGKDSLGNSITLEKNLWIGENGAAYNYRGGSIQMYLDKAYYKPGDKAKLLILSPISDIPFLFTMEGDTIISYKAEKFTKNSLLVTIPVKESFAPNIFATVSFIFNNQYYDNTIKINVPPLHKMLSVEIIPDQEQYRPQSEGKIKVKVKDSKGKAVKNAELSIAVVDEAIYGVSEEIAVEIEKFFYPFRRNNIRSNASIGFRFYGYSKNVREEIANKKFREPLGLASFKESEQEARENFKDLLLWIPDLRTDENGEAEFKIQFSDNITKWRITAVAMSEDTKVSKIKSHVIAKSDFFARIIHPAFFNEKDSSKVYTIVHNYTKEKLKGKAFFKAENALVKTGTQDFEVEAGSTKLLTWDVKPLGVGNVKLSVMLRAGLYYTQYGDMIVKTVESMPHSIQQVKTMNREINGSVQSIDFDMPSKIKKNTLKLTADLSYGYYSAVVASLPYLIHYPWGCVEQTTSSFLPNLAAANALKKMNIRLPEIEKKLPDIVAKGLSKLYGYQNKDGAWGWWGDSQKDVFMTAYVLYALTLTKQLGYSVRQDVYEKGIDALVSNLEYAKNDSELIYALYVLSLNGKNYPSILDKLKDKRALNDYELALMTLIYYQNQDLGEARGMADMLENRHQSGNNGIFWGKYRSEQWFLDDIETTAWVIRALALVKPGSPLIEKAVNKILMDKNENYWKSTRDTAAVVYALSDLMSRQEFPDNKKFTLSINQKKVGEFVFDRKNFKSRFEFSGKEVESLLKEKGNVFTVDGLSSDDKMILNFSMVYFTDSDEISANNMGLDVQKNYYKLIMYKDASGNIQYRIGDKTDRVKKGDPVLVEIKVNPEKTSNYLMVEDYFPAGTYPVKDFRLDSIENLDRSFKPDFVDYRSEKVAFFVEKLESETSFYYLLTPFVEGDYKIVPAAAFLMYSPFIYGNSDDSRLKVE
ncbi:MAG TPA: hypothetical protein DHW82_13610 [Spirochaetia bacterium]|nr:MAG: hypothetical protein A2Y41_08860 [Spirochaetes bacterium GWB1_36_13]HCL58026.1 hypothetical protein [Spirochaetia bacterium]